MLLATFIYAKFHLVSGFVIGGLKAAVAGQMKRSCKCSVSTCNSVKSLSESNDETISA